MRDPRPNLLFILARQPACQERIAHIRDLLWGFHRTELNEPAAALYPENTQQPTFNAQFKK